MILIIISHHNILFTLSKILCLYKYITMNFNYFELSKKIFFFYVFYRNDINSDIKK